MIIGRGDVLDTPIYIIAHQVNCKGVMGAGLAKQIRDKYPWVYSCYKKYCETYHYDLLGASAFFVNSDDTFKPEHLFMNIFGQDGYGRGSVQTDYQAFKNSITKGLEFYRTAVCNDSYAVQIPIAIPYGIGCGLAGGDWDRIKDILEEIEQKEKALFFVYKKED